MRFSEKDLKEKIKYFENKDITLQFDDLFEASIDFYKIKTSYNIKTGILNIKDSKNNNKLRINIASARYFEFIDNTLKIYLDYEINIILIKK